MAQKRNLRKSQSGLPGSFESLKSLKPEEEYQMLEFEPLKKEAAKDDVDLQTPYDNDTHSDLEEDPNDENIVPPKMNTLVGIVRFFNFASSTTVIFILVAMLLQDSIWTLSDIRETILNIVQLAFLAFFALLMYIDSIGTVSFCWREYGELSSLHTDSTSIIFLLCSNRWLFRFGSGFLFLTSLSLPIMDRLLSSEDGSHVLLPDSLFWVVALIGSCLISNGLGLLLSLCVSAHRVPWLLGNFSSKIVKDDADVWKRRLNKA